MKYDQASRITFNDNLIYSQSREQVICVSSRGTLIRYQLNQNNPPQIIQKLNIHKKSNIRPMDEDRFFLLSQSESSITIVRWDNWASFECFDIQNVEEFHDGFTDAVYLKEINIVICGGNWAPIIALNLDDSHDSIANANYGTEYVSCFSLSENNRYLAHSSTDMDSYFIVSSIDSDGKSISRLHGFFGEMRDHMDSIAFSDVRDNEFAHVFLGRPSVVIRRMMTDDLIEVVRIDLPLFDLPERYYIKKSTILAHNDSYLVATGKKVFHIVHDNDRFEFVQIAEYDEVINDIIRIGDKKYLLGLNTGLIELEI